MDSNDFANLIVLIGDNIRDFHARIRDHADIPEVVIDWLDRADEQLDVLMITANEALLTEATEGGDA